MKFIRKYMIILIIVLIVILITVGIILFLNRNPRRDNVGNSYKYNNEVVELPNTVTYKNEKLSEKHCLKNICISDVTFYYNEEIGRVEYTITNNSNKTVSGYLKMVFNDKSLVVVYKDLSPKQTINSFSQYSGIEINDKSDYKLEKLSKKEIKQIIK